MKSSRLLKHVIRHSFTVGCLAGLPCHALAADVPSEPYTWKSVTIGANGFINGVVYGPAKETPTYINTDMGGAYRLDGDRWTCLTDWINADDWSLNMMGVETLAIDPTDSNKVYLALGTYMGPSAIACSDDQGRTFKRTNVDFPMNGNGLGRNAGQRLNVDPNLPSRLLYGTRNKGLYESVDAAVTWHHVQGFPVTCDAAKPGKDVGLVWTLFDAASSHPNALSRVAYVGNCSTTPDKLFRTLDGGRSWEKIRGQPGGAMMPQHAALTADGKTLFATFVLAKEAPGPFGIVGGSVWRCDDPAGPLPAWTEITPTIIGNGGGWSGVSLTRESPATIYISSMNHYNGDGDDILRSRDDGKTWSPLHIKQHRDDSGYPYVRDIGIHWTGDVEVNPNNPNEGYFTTGFGLYRTTNLSDAEPTWSFFNKGFEQSAVTELKSPQKGSAYLISAIGDRDGYRHEDFDVSPKYGRLGQVNEFGQTKGLSMGTCEDLDIAFDKPDLCVRVGSTAQYSNDGGITWNGFDAGAAGSRGPRAGHIAISTDGEATVWAPGGHHPAMLAHRAATAWSSWADVSGLPNDADVIADPAAPGTFYALVDSAVFASSDGGKHFVRAGQAAKGSRMRATPGHAGHLWIAAGQDGLLHSADGGKTWVRVGAETATVARLVGIGVAKAGSDYPAVFVAGTFNGVVGYFRSDDQGRTWARVNDDAHQYGSVSVINGDSRVYGRLYLGSNGRGILVGEPTK